MQGIFEGRQVVVTGGDGALGSAVTRLLLQRGAVCHWPVRSTSPRRLDDGADERLHVVGGIDLVDQAAVERYYASLPELWASIHCAGAFAMAPLLDQIGRAHV